MKKVAFLFLLGISGVKTHAQTTASRNNTYSTFSYIGKVRGVVITQADGNYYAENEGNTTTEVQVANCQDCNKVTPKRVLVMKKVNQGHLPNTHFTLKPGERMNINNKMCIYTFEFDVSTGDDIDLLPLTTN